ncbi:hypothetical protein ACHWQZ_G002686 [Mnemiopsis leidyi]
MHVAYIKFIVCDKELQGWTLGREIPTGWTLVGAVLSGGKDHFLPQRKKICFGKDAAMKRIVGNYHFYENRVMEFLDELAQL